MEKVIYQNYISFTQNNSCIAPAKCVLAYGNIVTMELKFSQTTFENFLNNNIYVRRCKAVANIKAMECMTTRNQSL